MINIIVASHGKFAEELVHSSFMIFGEQENVSSLGFYPGEGIDDLRGKYKQVLDNTRNNESVILVDLFGGSPFNVAVEMASTYQNIKIVTGVNLGMLLEAYAYSSEESSIKVADLVSNCGKEAVIIYEELIDDEEDDL